MTRGVQQLLISLVAGVVFGLLRISYCLFPGFLLTDVILFGLAGAWIAYRWRVRWWLWTAAMLLPTLVEVGSGSVFAGNSAGAETSSALSAVLIATGAFGAGAATVWGRRRRGALASR